MGNCKSCVKPKTFDDDPGPSTSSPQHGNRIESGYDIPVNSGRPPSGKQRPSSARSNRDKSAGSNRSIGTTKDNSKPGVSAVVQGLKEVTLESERLPSAKQRPSSSKSNRVKSAGSHHTNDGSGQVDSSSTVRRINVKPSNYFKSDETSEDDAAVEQLLIDLFSKVPVINDIKDACQILWEAERKKPKLPYVNGRIEQNIDYKFSVRNGGVILMNEENFFKMRPTFEKFRLLLKCYSKGSSKNSNKFRKEILDFQTECKTTPVFLIFEKIVQSRYNVNEGIDQKLNAIWFQKQSAFQHIFAGGWHENGMHNWIQFYYLQDNLQWDENKIKQSDIVVKLKLEAANYRKHAHSMFIGTSPEFEISLYTILFLEMEKENEYGENVFELEFDGNPVNVKMITREGRNKLVTVYPMFK